MSLTFLRAFKLGTPLLALGLAFACNGSGDDDAAPGSGGSSGSSTAGSGGSSAGKGGSPASGGSSGTDDAGSTGSSGAAGESPGSSGGAAGEAGSGAGGSTGGSGGTTGGAGADAGSGGDAGSGSESAEWSNGFEDGFGDWYVEGGVWGIGKPTLSNNLSVFDGEAVAGTNLTGAYPTNKDARLISPTFVVPSASALPRLKYAYWYELYGDSFGELQIRTPGGAWQSVASTHLQGSTNTWSQIIVDLADYAGKTIQLAFHFVSDDSATRRGFYVDNVALETGAMTFTPPEGFEAGYGDWSVEGGVWAMGAPTLANNLSVVSGASVAGTHLRGAYQTNEDARLISPRFTVPAASEKPRLKYSYWYEFYGASQGILEIRKPGEDWEEVPTSKLTGSANTWSQIIVDLGAYAGETIQVAFHFTSDDSATRLGWYIDDVALETGDMTFDAHQGFESGYGDWSVEGGVWAMGSPTLANGLSVYAGDSVAGTKLRGAYSTNEDARLISPVFVVPEASAVPRLKYYYWTEFYGATYGQLELREPGGAWEPVAASRLEDSQDTWAPYQFDLTPYAGMTLQFAFHFASDDSATRLGWYLDEVVLETE